jgi:hypothetical protein
MRGDQDSPVIGSGVEVMSPHNVAPPASPHAPVSVGAPPVPVRDPVASPSGVALDPLATDNVVQTTASTLGVVTASPQALGAPPPGLGISA